MAIAERIQSALQQGFNIDEIENVLGNPGVVGRVKNAFDQGFKPFEVDQLLSTISDKENINYRETASTAPMEDQLYKQTYRPEPPKQQPIVSADAVGGFVRNLPFAPLLPNSFVQDASQGLSNFVNQGNANVDAIKQGMFPRDSAGNIVSRTAQEASDMPEQFDQNLNVALNKTLNETVKPVVYPLAMAGVPGAGAIAAPLFLTDITRTLRAKTQEATKQGYSNNITDIAMIPFGKTDNALAQGFIGTVAEFTPFFNMGKEIVKDPAAWVEKAKAQPASTMYDIGMNALMVYLIGKGLVKKAPKNMEEAKQIIEAEKPKWTEADQALADALGNKKHMLNPELPEMRQTLYDVLNKIAEQKWDKAEVTKPQLETRTVLGELNPRIPNPTQEAVLNALKKKPYEALFDRADAGKVDTVTRQLRELDPYQQWWYENAEGQPVARSEAFKQESKTPPVVDSVVVEKSEPYLAGKGKAWQVVFDKDVSPQDRVSWATQERQRIQSLLDGERKRDIRAESNIGVKWETDARQYAKTQQVGEYLAQRKTIDEYISKNTTKVGGKLYGGLSGFEEIARKMGLKGAAIPAEKGSVRAGISLAQDAKQGIIERGIQAGKQAYTDYVDSFSPIQNEVMRFEKETGIKLKPEESPYDLAKVAHTSTARAEMLVRGKTPEEIAALKQHYNLPHDVTIEKVVEQLPKGKLNEFLTKEGFSTAEDAFGGFLVAKRQLELQKQNPEYIAPIEANKAAEFIAKSPAEFHQAAESFYKYNDNLLQIAADEGLIAPEVASAIRAKYKNYAAMSRDFSDVSAMENLFGTGRGMVNVQGVLKRLKDGSERSVVNPLESAVKNTYVVLSRVERNKAGKAVADLGELSDGQFFAKKTDAAPDANKSIFSVYEKGEKVNYQTTPELYRALTSMNDEGVAQIVKILSYPAGWLRAGATLDPGFFVKNVTRDAFTAGIYSKYGFVPVYDTLMGVADIIGNKKLYAEYKASGAPMSVITGMDRASISKALSTIGKDGLPNPIEALRAMTAFFEDATRIREFQKAQQAGEGNVGQARAAQEVTLNFAGKGAKGTTPNQLVAFFNAQVQGINKLIQEHKSNPVGTAGKAAMYITAPSIGLWLLNHDDVRYQELPSWQRDLFWIVPTGQKLTRDRFNELMKTGKTKQQILDESGTLIRIPKPFELGLIYGSLPERFLDFAMTKDPKGLQKWAKTATESLIPNFLPTVAIPIIENMTNHSFFRDRPVVPRRKEGLPPSMQYTEQTTETAKYLGKQAERFTEGGISPAKIDNAIAGYLGGLGKTTIDTAETVAQLRNGKADKLLTEQPILRSFFVTPFKGADSVQEFYETYQRQSELKQAYDKTKAKDPAFNPALFMRMEQANKQVRELNKVARQIEESNQPSDKKRQALDKINLSVVGITRQALKK